MEQFVLGIFQEQLSKIIVDFRKEQVNANLLNGKGEIHNVELNCDFLNETMSRVTPFFELERVHVSKLSFHVTSWTNLRKAPILVDIEHVTARVVEPMESFVDRTRRRRIRQLMSGELFQLIRSGLVATRGPYNLFDRILDNLTIEIASVNVHFQPTGAFKTRAVGPWTPPAWQLTLASIRYCSVNEYGCEGPPDEIWRHNHHCTTSILIYKKLEMEYQVSILPHGDDFDGEPIPLVLGRDNRMQVQMALERRLRDGAILAVQVDTTCPEVEIDLPARAVAPLVHAVAGLQYCLSKDRAFVDPLRPDAVGGGMHEEDDDDFIEDTDEPLNSVTFTASDSGDSLGAGSGVVAVGDLQVPIEVMSSSSDSSEGGEGDSDEGGGDGEKAPKKAQQQTPPRTSAPPAAAAAKPKTTTPTPAKTSPTATATATTPAAAQSYTSSSSQFAAPDRPVILLPNGMVIYEKISLSLAVHHTTIRGTYVAEDDGHIQIVAKGFIGEAIWPKIDLQKVEKGGYVQISVAYVSVQERQGARIRTILVGGAAQQHGGGGGGGGGSPVENPTEPRPLLTQDETFPLYEDRSVRPDPLGLRYTFPEQAFGLKTTVGFIQKLPSKPRSASSQSDGSTTAFPATTANVSDGEEIHVLHELGIEHFDFILDSQSWCRALRFVLNEKNGGFDPRWHSGDWTECLTPKMLANPSVPLNLEECIQPTKQIFLDQNDFPSSDLFNVTARVKKVDLRVPAAILDDVRSCDIMMRLNEAMFVVSSALPRTFLSGRIGNSVNGEDAKMKGVIDFPNDPSDVAYVLERSEDPSDRQRGIMTSRAISTFRLQLTVRGFDVRLVPIIPIGVANDPQQLLAPTELSLIVCFEGEPPAPESNLTKIVFFTSVLAHRFDINFDFDLATSAIGTLAYHAKVVQSTVAACLEILQASKPTEDDVKASEHSDGGALVKTRIRKSLRGRKVLVTRQIHQSRETGGLSVAFCLQAAGFSFTLWRQNVPYNGPLRSPTQSTDGLLDTQNAHLPLLKLMWFDAEDFEVGVEATFRRQHRRVVLKACLSEMELRACDFTRLQQKTAVWVRRSSQGEDTPNRDESRPSDKANPSENVNNCDLLVEVFKLGGGSGMEGLKNISSESGVALRIEERMEEDAERSWTYALDVEKGAVLYCHTEAIEALVLLVFEALLLPAWAKHDAIPSRASIESWAFPAGSIGALLLSLVRLPVPATEFSPLDIQLPIDSSSSQVPGGLVDRLLCDLIDRVIPEDVRVILIRYKGSDIFVKVPSDGHCFGFLIERSEFLISYLAADSMSRSEVMEVLGQRGEKWSSIIPSKEAGLRHSLRSRQRLLRCGINPTSGRTDETLVEPFECGYDYAKSKAYLSMADNIVVDNVEMLDQFLACLQTFGRSCLVIAQNVSHVISTVRRPEYSRGSTVDEEAAKRNPVEMACSSTAEVIRSARESLMVSKDEFEGLHSNLKRVLRARDLEIMSLRRLVFKKERERLGAAALVSAAATGWLRIGSAQRTGNRGLMTSNLWPQWAKLRRSLLILYPGPTGLTPTDIINVSGATLCQLTGGTRRRDLKRAFAIVERSGVMHLVVTSTDDEYYRWIQEITRFAEIEGEDEMRDDSTHSGLDASLSSAADDDASRLSSQTPRNQKISVGRSITRAVNVAKSTRQAVRRRADSVSSGTEDIADSLLGSTPLELDTETRRTISTSFSVDDADSNVSDGLSSSNHGRFVGKSLTRAVQVAKVTGQIAKATGKATGQIAKATGQAVVDQGRRIRTHSEEGSAVFVTSEMLSKEEDEAQSRPETTASSIGGRQQSRSLGQVTKSRFSGVGQVTKSRFGSAFQAARQKGMDVRMRMNQGDVGNLETLAPPQLDAIVESPDKLLSSLERDSQRQSLEKETGWSCSACTFINQADSLGCEVCGTPKSANANTAPLGDSSEREAKPASSSSEVVESSTTATENALTEEYLDEQDDGPEGNREGDESMSETAELQEDSIRSETENLGARPGMKERLGAAVRSVRRGNGTQDGERTSGRFDLRRRRSSQQDETNSMPEPVKLRNVKLNGPLSLPPHPIHGTKRIVPEVLSKRLEGSWIVRVEAVSIIKHVPLISKARSAEPEQAYEVDESELNTFKNETITTEELDLKSLQPTAAGLDEAPRSDAPGSDEAQSSDTLPVDLKGAESVSTTAQSYPIEVQGDKIQQVNGDHHSDTNNNDPESRAVDADDGTKLETIKTTIENPDLNDDARASSDAVDITGNDTRNDPIPRTTTLALESVFRIKVLKQEMTDDESSDFEQVLDITKSLSDILQLHTQISESITHASMTSLELSPPPPAVTGETGSRKGEMKKSLAVSLGLTTVDAVRITGKVLAGLLEVSPVPDKESFHKCCAETVSEFLNSMLDCALPVDGLMMLVDFLGLSDASTTTLPEIDVCVRGLEADDVQDTDECPEELLNKVLSIGAARDPFALSAVSDAQLVRAENQALLAARLAGSAADISLAVTDSSSSEMSQPAVSHQFREAMYSALMTVMEERDEAHARTVAASVLHVHEMEQQRKAMRRLSSEIDSLKCRRDVGASSSSSNDSNKRLAEKAMLQDSEAELLSLCQQLGSEISARTSASLEVIRLKESRRVERENEAAERQALEEELKRTRELLATDRSKLERSRRESRSWMHSYEEVVQVSDPETSATSG